MSEYETHTGTEEETKLAVDIHVCATLLASISMFIDICVDTLI